MPDALIDFKVEPVKLLVDAKFVPSNVSADPVVRTLEASRNATPFAVPPFNVTVLEVVSVVKAPVEGVVAPTVPLMLMEAVPVRFVTTPDAGVPRAGVTKVGLVANTKAPVPVSSVTAEAKLALEGVPKKVAIPVPKEVIPVPPFATGRVPVMSPVLILIASQVALVPSV